MIIKIIAQGEAECNYFINRSSSNPIHTVVFPPISAEKVDIARCCAPRQKNANNTRSKILLQKKVGAIDNTES